MNKHSELQESAHMNQSDIQSHLLHNNSSKVSLYSASCTVMQSVDFFYVQCHLILINLSLNDKIKESI